MAFQRRKGCIGLQSPAECHGSGGESSEGSCNTAVVLDKPAKNVRKTKETLELLMVDRDGPPWSPSPVPSPTSLGR